MNCVPQSNKSISCPADQTCTSSFELNKSAVKTITATQKAYILSKDSTKSMSLAIIISPITSLPVRALLDSGATRMFISWDFIQKHELETYHLPHPIAVHNVDGSPNKHGSITEEVELILCYENHSKRAHLAVANIGWQSIIIGYPWLLHHNLEINWKKNSLTLSHCPTQCSFKTTTKRDGDTWDMETGNRIYVMWTLIEDSNEICTSEMTEPGLTKSTFEDLVPKQYHDFCDIFSKDEFNSLPPHKTWDHAIELVLGTDLLRAHMYPLSPVEQKELDGFIQENLANGRIHPSKSPLGTPAFFMKKKDGSLCLTQDYCKLNDITIKNSYPLPLISDMLNHLCYQCLEGKHQSCILR